MDRCPPKRGNSKQRAGMREKKALPPIDPEQVGVPVVVSRRPLAERDSTASEQIVQPPGATQNHCPSLVNSHLARRDPAQQRSVFVPAVGCSGFPWKSRVWRKRSGSPDRRVGRLTGGDPLELAEIVRNGARRERTFTADGTNSKLSISEKALCVKARRLLAGEIGLARGLDRAVVETWIDEQLVRIGS